jgi:hypothetical protein
MTPLVQTSAGYTVQQLTGMNALASKPADSSGGGEGGIQGLNLLDSDGDGYSDFIETIFGTDPEQSWSNPGIYRRGLVLEKSVFTAYSDAGSTQVAPFPDGREAWSNYWTWWLGLEYHGDFNITPGSPSLPNLQPLPDPEEVEWDDWSFASLPDNINGDAFASTWNAEATDTVLYHGWSVGWGRLRLATEAPLMNDANASFLLIRTDTPPGTPETHVLGDMRVVDLQLPAGQTAGGFFEYSEPPAADRRSEFNLFKMPFYTKGGPWNTPQHVDFCYNGTATSVIDAQVTACTISGAGVVTLTLSGDITDATSDLIDDPAKQLASVDVTAPGGNPVTLELENETDPEDPPDLWRPYPWQSSFSATVSFTAGGEGDYPVSITTALNAGGMAGATEAVVHVSTSQLNVALSAALNSAVADQITFYTGSTPSGDPGETYTETGADTKIFNAGASSTFQVEVRNPQPLTSDVDTLSIRLTWDPGTAQERHTDYSLTETGAETNTFSTGTLYSAGVSQPVVNHPGNFLPIIICFPPLDVLKDEDLTINIMDRDWKLKEISTGGLYGLFVVDDQDNPVVFNPSAYAHTHIQTKKVSLAEGFKVKFSSGAALAEVTLHVIQGLVVQGSDVSKMLGNLTGWEAKSFHAFGQGTQSFYYSPKKNATLGHGSHTDVETEILWRYVGTKDTIVMFNSKAELERDLFFRKAVCKYARRVAFDFGPEMKGNKQHWSKGSVANQVVGLASAAVNDPFTSNALLYEMGCSQATQFIGARALLELVGADRFNEIHQSPLPVTLKRLYQQRVMSNMRGPEKPQEGWEDAETNWIPGDIGHIRNDLNDEAHTALLKEIKLTNDPIRKAQLEEELQELSAVVGENVVYLGGLANNEGFFGSNFEQGAYFFGHLDQVPLRTFKAWKDAVKSWSTDGNITVLSERGILQQP